MQDDIYTKKVVGIFADDHALLEPLEAILEDMKSKGITEIYSLGDNIGVGPNPSEVMDLMQQYNVVSIAGNSEEYCTLGIKPFQSYFTNVKIASQNWTLSKLTNVQKEKIKSFPHSIELFIGNKKIILCHFANDVRFDFAQNSTWSYQEKLQNKEPAYKQFLYTNSKKQLEYMDNIIKFYGEASPNIRGFISAKKDPLLKGKTINDFDYIIQGHVHFKLYEKTPKTQIYSIRAAGIGYKENQNYLASYITVREKKQGDIEIDEILVPFKRDKMIKAILDSNSPDYTIAKFVGIKREEDK